MCGIAGIYDPGNKNNDERTLRRMLYQLRHRGPDEYGIYLGKNISLGHARLSIIDLSTGNQPMTNEDATVWIIFNGEIFNYIELREYLLSKGHVFKTSSDTEVLLHLYEEKGVELLNQLNGQFSFSIWDKKKESLFLARDRVGICPLYYTENNGSFIFASEIKAIFAHDAVIRKIDPIAVDDIFTFWFPLSPRTIFDGVYELPPAHYMILNNKGKVIKRYWDLPSECDQPGKHDEQYYNNNLLDLLIDSTKIRLRADVPVGAYLSGGLDSSIIASIIKRHASSELCTFSVKFTDLEFDESIKQNIMSAYLKTNHKDITCGYDDIVEHFTEVLWHTEVPIVRTAPVPLYILSGLVRKNSFKVVLTGEGADEILAGYDIFKESKIRRFVARYPDSRYRHLLLKKLYPYLKNSPTKSLSYATEFFGKKTAPFKDRFYSHATRWKMTEMAKIFYSDNMKDTVSNTRAEDRIERLFSTTNDLDPMALAQEIEIKTLLPNYLLSSQGDRMLMANSVEGRFPFLDHRVIEFCMKMPAHLRMNGLTEKYILRKSTKNYLPGEISKMVKQPYRSPDGKCFSTNIGSEIVMDMLSMNNKEKNMYFDGKKVEKLFNKFIKNSAIGYKDNIAFIAIISTLLIKEMFINKYCADDMYAENVQYQHDNI